jgi:hypothetical protein
MGQPDGWVNAVIEFTVPLDDVSVDDSDEAKQDAVGGVMDRLLDELPQDLLGRCVSAGHWEDAGDE